MGHQIRLGLLLLVWILFGTACGQPRSKSSVQPPKDIKASFTAEKTKVAADTELVVDKYKIGVRRSALEKEFLLRAEVMTQTLAPQFSGLRSRIIAFREHGDELLMLEATQGHQVDQDATASLLLAKFKIEKEVDGVLYFDLNEGFKSLYVAGDWYASDFSGTMYDVDGTTFKSMPLTASYIDKAEFDSLNQLIITQVGQLESTGGPEGRRALRREPIQTKYYFTTYQPDTSFHPSESDGNFSQFGYFETNPRLSQEGAPALNYTKFNVEKPVIYAVSANTPDEFKEAVREGILYWNKAFGREVLKVVEAPKGVRAPNSELNIVQWVNWDWAGFAYADAQMDPRTGQILNSQIFMTSAFAVIGKARARQLLRKMASPVRPNGTQLGLKGFLPSSLCHRTFESSFTTTLSAIVANPAVTDQDVLRAAQDYVREVVAHEVGHTLGLRHNFAGSLAANYKLSDRPEIVNQYLTQSKVDPTLITTSSVMEYDDYSDSILAGHQMKTASAALKYDEMAIRHLYDGQAFARGDTPAYCPDSLAGKLADCMVWDSGPSVVESNMFYSQEAYSSLPALLMEKFIGAKTPLPGFTAIPLERLSLDVETMVDRILEPRLSSLDLLTKDSRLLSVERNFDVVDAVNSDDVQARKLEYIKQDMDRLGGLKAALPLWQETDTVQLLGQMDAVIASGQFDKGIGNNGQSYSFTPAEISLIRDRSRQAIQKAAVIYREKELEALAKWKGELVNHSLAKDYADLLQSRVEDLLFAKTVTTIHGFVTLKDKSQLEVNLPVFKAKQDMRMGAFEVFKRESTPSADWAYTQKEIIRAKFKDLLNAVFSDKFSEVTTQNMSPEVLKWYLENRAVYGSLYGPGESPDRDEAKLLSQPVK